MVELSVFAVDPVKSRRCNLLVIWARASSNLYLCIYLFGLVEVPSCKKPFSCNVSGGQVWRLLEKVYLNSFCGEMRVTFSLVACVEWAMEWALAKEHSSTPSFHSHLLLLAIVIYWAHTLLYEAIMQWRLLSSLSNLSLICYFLKCFSFLFTCLCVSNDTHCFSSPM